MPGEATTPARLGFASMGLVVLLGALALMRWLVSSQLPLSEDEAYYTAWSLTPDWGYWTKPPLIAWVIGAFREVLGPTVDAVRAVPAVAFFLSSLVFHRLMHDLGAPARMALVATLLFATMPLVSFYGLIATTDGLLMLCWLLAMRSAWLALEGAPRQWLFTGLWVGLGLLSKYSMVVFLGSLGLALLQRRWRAHWRSPWLYVGAGVAALIFAPNLWWNWTQGSPTLHHTAQISGGGIAYGWHWSSLLEFWLAQWAITGVVLMLGFVLWLKRKPWQNAPAVAWVLTACVPLMLVISVQALSTRAHANWAAPALVGVVFGGAWWLEQGRRVAWLNVALGLHVAFMAALYGYDPLAQRLNIRPSVFTDPFWTLRSWPHLNQAVVNTWWTQASEVPRTEWRIASEDRGILAQVQATLNLPAGNAMGWVIRGVADNHFDQRFPLPSQPAQPVLLITRQSASTVKAQFAHAQPAQHVIIRRIPDAPLDVQFWWLKP